MKILSDKPRRDGQETKGSARDLTATESRFNSPHPASPCRVIWQYSSIFEAQLHHISPFSSWMRCHFELYFISPLWISVTWSGLPGNKSTWIVQAGYILMYFAVSLRKQLCLQYQNTWKKHTISTRCACSQISSLVYRLPSHKHKDISVCSDGEVYIYAHVLKQPYSSTQPWSAHKPQQDEVKAVTSYLPLIQDIHHIFTASLF